MWKRGDDVERWKQFFFHETRSAIANALSSCAKLPTTIAIVNYVHPIRYLSILSKGNFYFVGVLKCASLHRAIKLRTWFLTRVRTDRFASEFLYTETLSFGQSFWQRFTTSSSQLLPHPHSQFRISIFHLKQIGLFEFILFKKKGRKALKKLNW